MVVHKGTKFDSAVVPSELDLGYLGLFLGLRINELVAESLASAGFGKVKQSHGYVVQHLIEQDRTITELAGRMEVTQQAASKVVREMMELGILEAVPAEDRRAKQIRLSSRGWQSVKLARTARRRIEARLRAKTGAAYAGAKATLLACLTELGGLKRIESRRIREPR
ncbi:MAG TPA: MarR family transcriptional regulator [Bryobacteraceae bacterium]|nr:MarR family transcriptional regulator [Bryobacteraceae bacterium]